MLHFEMSLGTGGTLASSPGAGYFSTHCRNASASGPGFVRCQVPSRCRRPPPAAHACTAVALRRRRSSYVATAAGTSSARSRRPPPVRSAASQSASARAAASSKAWLAPWPGVGWRACAASPSSVTRPAAEDQAGSGCVSKMRLSKIPSSAVARITRRMSLAPTPAAASASSKRERSLALMPGRPSPAPRCACPHAASACRICQNSSPSPQSTR
mmetsp:Transcript_7454/g.24556  ORF Transcript_7454/g.24556 Transcript_7454/m.24556 type:complete len:214 (-) Transcript_7454:1011-1652(-)